MKFSDLSDNWTQTFTLIALTGFIFMAWGCPSKTESLITPGERITRPELQVELDTIIATAEYRLADLDKQDAFRDIIFKNATLMIETGSLNPFGVLTMLAGIYGVTRGVKDVKNRVQKKAETS